MTDEPMATVPTRVLKGCLWLAEWVRETHRPDQQPTMLSGPDGLLPTLYNLVEGASERRDARRGGAASSDSGPHEPDPRGTDGGRSKRETAEAGSQLLGGYPATATVEALLARATNGDILFVSPRRFAAGTVGERLDQPDARLAMAAAFGAVPAAGEYVDYRGTPVLAAVRRVPDTDWGVVVKVDLAEVRAGFHRELRDVWTLTLGVAVAVLGLTTAFARVRQATIEGDRLRAAARLGAVMAAETGLTVRNTAALAANATPRAWQALEQLASGQFEDVDGPTGHMAAIKALLGRPCQQSEDILLRSLIQEKPAQPTGNAQVLDGVSA